MGWSFVHLLVWSICRANIHADIIFTVIFFELPWDYLVLTLISSIWVVIVRLDFLYGFYVHIVSSTVSVLWLNCNALLVELLVWRHYWWWVWSIHVCSKAQYWSLKLIGENSFFISISLVTEVEWLIVCPNQVWHFSGIKPAQFSI